MTMERELRGILEAFAASGWDELAVPARRFLAGALTAPALREAVLRAQAVCGIAAAPSTRSIPGRLCCWKASGNCVTKREHSLNLLSK